MLKPISESNIIKRYSQPPGAPVDENQGLSGTISTFPSSPLDVPTATFESNLKRRQENHQKLIAWIRENLHPDIDYGRIHIDETCQYARAGVPYRCRDFSHFSSLTLWKSGAEKILHVLGLSAHYPNLNQYEIACVHKSSITQVILTCQLKNQNARVVGEGAGARHLKQDEWNINKAVKMAMKCALVDAVIRVAGLTGIFVKTQRHAVRYKVRDRSGCNHNKLSSGGNCNGDAHQNIPQEKPITPKQKDCITRVSGIKGFTTESLNRFIQEQFSKALDDLNRVEAHHLIQHING
jgi:hypothetical protein